MTAVEARNHYELREAQHRGVDPTEMLLEGLTTDQIRALDKRVRHTEQEKADIMLMRRRLADFSQASP